jgi:hypothetical protein
MAVQRVCSKPRCGDEIKTIEQENTKMTFRNRRFAVLLLMVCLLALAGVSVGFAASARQQQAAKCPKTKVICPASVKKGDSLTYTANVSGGDQNVTPTYNWSVSAGSIESGQGTSTITVDTKEVAADSTITATVELGGFDRECGYGSTVDSCTTIIEKK